MFLSPVCFSLKRMWLKWKSLNFYPVDCMLLCTHEFKKIFQPLTLEWLKQWFSNFFEHEPNLSLVNTPQTTAQVSNNVWKKWLHGWFWLYVAKFVLNISNPLFSEVSKPTQKHAVVTLKTHNPGLDHLGATHFLTLRHSCSGFDAYFEKHRARSTNQSFC